MRGLLITFLITLAFVAACSTEPPSPVQEIDTLEEPKEELEVVFQETPKADEVKEAVVGESEDRAEPVNCDHNVECFINGIKQDQPTYYWGEGLSEPMPGVSHWTPENWTYTPHEDASYTLLIVSNYNAAPQFAEGWFESYARSESAPDEIRSLVAELDAAQYPTEEELAQMDEEVRSAIEEQIESGKSASEIAWEQATYTQEYYLSSMIPMGSMTYTCSSTNKTALLEALNRLGESPVLSPGNLNFLECTGEMNF
ncbi:hypothetical protein IPG41_05140 [Candidatus Peregrinibacteria bacterium]|nr:MAG: hypothetical protein IPG41_05140 [Candidatus Peregrinibacteria bacterium]